MQNILNFCNNCIFCKNKLADDEKMPGRIEILSGGKALCPFLSEIRRTVHSDVTHRLF